MSKMNWNRVDSASSSRLANVLLLLLFQVHVFENGHHLWSQVYLLRWTEVHYDWTKTLVQMWVPHPSWVDLSVVQKAGAYINSCFHIITWEEEQFWEYQPGDGGRGTKQLISSAEWPVGYWVQNESEAKERKTLSVFSAQFISGSDTS